MKSLFEMNKGYRVDSQCLLAHRVSGSGGAWTHYPWLGNHALYSTPGVHYRVWEPAGGVGPECFRFLEAGGGRAVTGRMVDTQKYESKIEKLISAHCMYITDECYSRIHLYSNVETPLKF